MRFGREGARTAERNDVAGAANDNGSAGCSPHMASNSSARSSTLRAIGPCTLMVRSTCAPRLCAIRPKLGRIPTMPQKLAGLRSDPPRSVPWASHAVPLASAAAAPPEEPAADIARFQGLRVAPNTSLKVLAPAPNSGVLDL